MGLHAVLRYTIFLRGIMDGEFALGPLNILVLS